MANAVVAQLSAKPTVEERFWAKVSTAGPAPDYRPDLGPCWLWLGVQNRDGYGQFKVRGHMAGAHRFAYELLVGSITEAMELDHLCRVRRCVNPAHLEPVTHRENMRRGETGLATALQRRAKTNCPKGHPYDAENTYWQGNRRSCRTCRRAHNRAWRAR